MSSGNTDEKLRESEAIVKYLQARVSMLEKEKTILSCGIVNCNKYKPVLGKELELAKQWLSEVDND